ncbi:MAG: hypothetical protein JWR09_959 [Mucilaginibacter sp.]|nr:hypothetical protein [Mucilaginibacter sp.]
MSNATLVSVIIPIYNAEPYIEDCISSVLGQTWPNLEIIIIDDGSTDNSFERANALSADNITIITQANAGASAARNNGLRHAKGEHIQFLDADDLLSTEKIRAQMDILAGKPDYLALCPTAYFDDGSPPVEALPLQEWFAEGSDDPVDFLIKLYNGYEGYGGMIQTNAWLAPRKLIDKAGWWNEMRNPDDDGEFFCRVILAGKGVGYTDKGISYYRKFQRKNTWSNRSSYKNQQAVLQSWILKSEHLKSHENMTGIRKALAYNFTELSYSNYPVYKDLSKKAIELATAYGGFSHPPYFGNRAFNKLRWLLPWKILLRLQYFYQWLKGI